MWGRHTKTGRAALTRITHGIFYAGFALQAARNQPGEVLRQAAEHMLLDVGTAHQALTADTASSACFEMVQEAISRDDATT